MPFVLQPWQLYLTLLAGWMNREQQQVIEYLKAENQVLREKLGKQRILLTDNQRYEIREYIEFSTPLDPVAVASGFIEDVYRVSRNTADETASMQTDAGGTRCYNYW